MGNRRRNLFVLLDRARACARSRRLVIAKKPTVLGLDLKGGTQLVYVARPTPQEPVVTADDINRAIEIIRQRADKLGVSEPEISRVGSDQIQVGLPNVSNAKRAIDQIGTTAQLYLYDFERNVIPPPHSSAPEGPGQLAAAPQGPDRPTRSPNEYSAVKFAGTQKPKCFKNECTANGPTYYLFNERATSRSATRPRTRRTSTASSSSKPLKKPSRRRPAHGPPGHRRPLRARRRTTRARPPTRARPGRRTTTSCTTARRSPALTSPTRSRASTRSPTSRIVTFGFTDRGGRRSRR